MNLSAVLILVVALVLVGLLVAAPSATVRKNPFPGRRARAGHRRPGAPRSTRVPGQRDVRHHAR
ncbi:hypothetical protein EDE04_1096 [Streptomyces sp. 2132.2]|uniref:Uncharacterized protein n=1 Tax=Streptomyces vinaceus TaxID=1960 RepID=A0A5J6J2T9_STRVI|nr:MULTISPECIES: hypothetical protein [Streptomyces]QEV44483.1 hypothetical protein CP980_04830 [Streptomyces vinaceus]ROQ94666.1 hypothetical protein EDE04_1096 [Streptomyces sp. 2132.2]